jgi:hypothetical protein
VPFTDNPEPTTQNPQASREAHRSRSTVVPSLIGPYDTTSLQSLLDNQVNIGDSEIEFLIHIFSVPKTSLCIDRLISGAHSIFPKPAASSAARTGSFNQFGAIA